MEKLFYQAVNRVPTVIITQMRRFGARPCLAGFTAALVLFAAATALAQQTINYGLPTNADAGSATNAAEPQSPFGTIFSREVPFVDEQIRLPPRDDPALIRQRASGQQEQAITTDSFIDPFAPLPSQQPPALLPFDHSVSRTDALNQPANRNAGPELFTSPLQNPAQPAAQSPANVAGIAPEFAPGAIQQPVSPAVLSQQRLPSSTLSLVPEVTASNLERALNSPTALPSTPAPTAVPANQPAGNSGLAAEIIIGSPEQLAAAGIQPFDSQPLPNTDYNPGLSDGNQGAAATTANPNENNYIGGYYLPTADAEVVLGNIDTTAFNFVNEQQYGKISHNINNAPQPLADFPPAVPADPQQILALPVLQDIEEQSLAIESDISDTPTSGTPTEPDGYYQLHLASYFTIADAQRGLQIIDRVTAGAIAGLPDNVQPIVIRGRQYYRLLVGIFANLQTAAGLCDRIKQNFEYCQVMQQTG